MATRNEIIEVLNLVKSLPNCPMKDAESIKNTVDLFVAVLEDLPVEMVRTATVQYCSEGNPFFPMPGVIRDKAMELQLLALGIPTPAEAWGMVLKAIQYTPREYCETGMSLRENYDSKNGQLVAYMRHLDECGICGRGGFTENYGHAAVEETVKLIGGRDAIFTDNLTADRARFSDAYREIIAKERMKLAMLPSVAAYIETVKPVQIGAGTQVKQLAERLSK
jgi:hypothetical protein